MAESFEDKFTKYIGSPVKIVSLKTRGTLLEAPDRKGRCLVLIGAIELRIASADLEFFSSKGSQEKQKFSTQSRTESKISKKLLALGGQSSLDLHGLRYEEAARLIDEFIDRSVLEGRDSLILIHGKGQGVLKTLVHKRLKNSPQISRFELNSLNQGETIAWI